MECQQFMLDLSGNSAIPSHYKISMSDVVKWIFIQTKGYVDIQTTNHYNRGCFLIQTGNVLTAKFLASFELEIRVNGVRHLVPLRQILPDTERTRMKFWMTCKGQIARLPNKYFDDILEAAGCTVQEPTFKSTHRHTTVYDGFRIAYVVRGDDHMDRNHEYIADDGKVFKWRLDYEGQPFYCFRGCDIFHGDGKCPKWEKIKERRDNDGQQKIYIAASSLFRHASDTKLTQVVAIPGAKIGHIANHINNDTKMFEKAEVLVVAAGSNMDLGTVEASKPYVEEQAKELTKVIKPMAETKKVFIVDPLVGTLDKDEPAGQHWAMVRQRMKKVSKEAKATWISLEAVQWKPEEDVAEDGTHYTPAGTKKVLEVVGAKVKEVAGVDMMLGMEVEERPYAGVFNGHYKFGCPRCTKVHERGRCPEIPLPIGSPNHSNDTTTFGEPFHSFEANNSNSGNNSNNSSSNSNNNNNNNNNSLNLLSLESDEDVAIQSSQSLPHFTAKEKSTPLAPGSIIRADRVIEATTTMTTSILEALAAGPQPPPPSPSFNNIDSPTTISGVVRSNPELRNRSTSAKRARDSIGELVENSLEKKKKAHQDKKPKGHVSRVQNAANAKK